ncbi:hypothetical protein vseg_020431 [Gypsophila vaccaria]
MQRQSLGSPTRDRLVISAVDDTIVPRSDRRESCPPSSFSTAAVDDEIKPDKRLRSNSLLSSPAHKFIHFIPLLILCCFLVLFFSSHDPSPQELARFHGVLESRKHIDEITETKDIIIDDNINNSNKELKRSGAFVMRNSRNLQEKIVEKGDSRSQSHRKLGDF